MTHQDNESWMRYSAKYSSPPPHYGTVDQNQTIPYASRRSSQMDQNLPSYDTTFQTNNFNAAYEVNKKPLASVPSYPDTFPDTITTPHLVDQLQNASTFSNATTDLSHSNNATQAYENDRIETSPAITNPFNNVRYNRSSHYSLENNGSDYYNGVSATYVDSTGNISQQTLSSPQIHQHSMNTPNYGGAEFPKYGSDLSLQTSYPYPSSTPQRSSSRYRHSILNSLTTAPNDTSMGSEAVFSAPQYNKWHMEKPPDIQYTPLENSLAGGTMSSAYAQPQDLSYMMIQVDASPNRDGQTSQYHDHHMSRQTLQTPVLHQQRRISVPTNSFASMDLNSSEPLYDYDGMGYADTIQHRQYQTHHSHRPSQSTTIDDISPRKYPSKCPHSDCLSKPNKTKSFTRENEWRDHFYRTHEKRYRCDFTNCLMVFGTEADAKRHRLAVHKIGKEEAKQYSCSVQNCGARQMNFTRGDKFKDHRDRWHGPFYCTKQDCTRGSGHGFRDQAALDAHSQKKHIHG
ncbi:hypothetical protein OCU04_010384 [Sclerotinia nivalis]|uniref:C2H2-type domain-containing protein n=1 Tax=Sclerotinia nivalis TaxID=352851 RepID=A0A9X0DF69_9HELO|nr:hypothetical protein OCU04_010384 [Sclerotinia nivalis]